MSDYCHVILSGGRPTKVCVKRTDGKPAKPMTTQAVNGKTTVQNGIRINAGMAGKK